MSENLTKVAIPVREAYSQTTEQGRLKAVQAWPHWDEIGLVAAKEYRISTEEYQQYLPECQKFLTLVSIGHHGLGMFNAHVDTIWHSIILSTLRYEDFCQQFNDGQIIHHLPQLTTKADEKCTVCVSCTNCSIKCKGGKEIPGEPASLKYFLTAYTQAFGTTPPTIWNLPEADGFAA